MIQETSRLAYRKVRKKLGRRQVEVLQIFTRDEDKNFTNMEVAEMLGWSINRVTPRVKELREKGYLRLVERRRCSITGNLAMAWMLNWASLTTAHIQGIEYLGDIAFLPKRVPRNRWVTINQILKNRGYEYIRGSGGQWKISKEVDKEN